MSDRDELATCPANLFDGNAHFHCELPNDGHVQHEESGTIIELDGPRITYQMAWSNL